MADGRRPRRAARGGSRPPLSFAAPLCAALLLALAAGAAASDDEWQVVTDLLSPLPGVEVSIVGPPQQAFARPPPRSLDPHLLADFGPQLNLLQDVSADGDNLFTDVHAQYVATVHSAFVEGEGGLVYDAAGRAYHPPGHFFTRTSPLQPLPQRSAAQAAAECERHAVLASVVQRYGHMYYHFVEEALPRVALLAKSGRLTSDVKLLTWGQPYEYEFLEALGVNREQVVPFNASCVYCADRLLVPTPTPRITPPREALQLVRQGLGVRTLPEAQRDLVVYVSRQGETSRRVANEEALLAAIRGAFPQHQVAVYGGAADGLSLQQTIDLFQRARVVLGPHGAGLSHILFSAPGTTVVEFLFLAEPPLMFWHTAAALGQPYWLLPVPQAYWMQEEMQVPTEEVLDILAAALFPGAIPGPAACLPGTYASAEGSCTTCYPGSYASNAGWTACKPCAPGRYAPTLGATACRTCQPGTFSSADGSQCLACPAGTFSTLPGAWDVAQCLSPEQRLQQQADQALNVQLLSKLSPVFDERRRRLIEQTGTATLSQAELCAAQRLAGSDGDAYRGPYLAGVLTAAALLANCTDVPAPLPGTDGPLIGVVVASPPAEAPLPPSPQLPPVEVPVLPPYVAPEDPVVVPVVPVETRGTETPVTATPSPPPAPEAQLYPKKKVVDNYVIILASVLGGLLVLPMLAWAGRRMWLAHQHRKARASAARRPLVPGPASSAGPARAFANPTFQPALVDEDAASVSSAGQSHA